MDSSKKQQQNYARPNSKACQPTETNRKSADLQANKPWPKNSRRRENPSAPRTEPLQRNSKQSASAKTRVNVDKRPRPRAGYVPDAGSDGIGGGEAACAADDVFATGTGLATVARANGAATGAVSKNNAPHDDYYELNSIYAPGSKKQNLNHLLNFHYGHNVFGRHGGNGGGGGGGGSGGGMHRQYAGAAAKRHTKYNKEQFLQANFQFVIKANAKPPLTASPDTLIAWDVIEQINIQTTEEPQCPICLYPPIAAKLTRCGHAYCWPCILHYLALSDKTWRKCPICYEAIHISDLKSTAILQQRSINVGNMVAFHLMRRKKGSMFIEKYERGSCGGSTAAYSADERYPNLSGDEEAKRFSKFLIATRPDIAGIIERERRELTSDEDASCPEFVFIQQALDLLSERRTKLGDVLAAPIAREQPPVDDAVVFEDVVPSLDGQAAVTRSEDDDGLLEQLEMPGSPTHSAQDGLLANGGVKYYYFYQSMDGQNIYLHPLNVKMLQVCYGSLELAPPQMRARILQKEHHSMDEEHRRKFTCLGHLPLTCQFAVVEIDLQPPMISDDVLRLFKDELLFRKKERQRRDREERKREKHINEINDRQMGKLIASTTQLNLTSSHEFPTCGFEEPLLSASADAADGNNTATAPITVAQHASYSTVAVIGGGSAPKAEYWPTLDLQSTQSYGNNNTNRYQPLAASAAWGSKVTPMSVLVGSGRASNRSSECESEKELFGTPTVTNLCDVLTEAMMSQQKQKTRAVAAMAMAPAAAATAGNTKKGRRGKKMTPVFSTGMNFSA